MGLYDTLRIECRIPGFAEIPKCQFQTKSFDSALENYVISDNGELYREVWDYEWVKDDNLLLKGYSKKVKGSYRREYLTDFHGDIIFYSSVRIGDYTARFTEGKLTRIWYEDKQH